MSNTFQVFRRIRELQTRYLRSVGGKESLLRLIYESEVTEQVYNSNAIENSTLSLEETDKILNQIDLDRFVNERELFEAKNLARVVGYIDQKAKQETLTLEMMLLLHKLLISNIQDDIAGRFRKADEWVRVGSHIATDPAMVIEQLENMMIAYHTSAEESIITRIARFHLSFEHIHPFVDGNGRIGRVLNNYLLIREGYVPINIKFIDRSDYYDAFATFDKKSDLSLMEQIVGKAITSSYHKRLAYLEGRRIISLAEHAKVSKQSHSNLINKAKRQTIEAFWERGIWKIGV